MDERDELIKKHEERIAYLEKHEKYTWFLTFQTLFGFLLLLAYLFFGK